MLHMGRCFSCEAALCVPPQADKTSLLELPQVELSSKVLFAAAAGLSFVMAVM